MVVERGIPSEETPVTEQKITMAGLEKMFADSEPQLVDGASQDCIGELDIDPARLLKKVIAAVISHGQGHTRIMAYDTAPDDLKPALLTLARVEQRASELRKGRGDAR